MHEIDQRIFRELALPRQLFEHDRVSTARHFTHFVGRQIVQRMRRHEQRQIVELKIFCREMAVSQKCRRDHGRRRHAAFFEIDRVVDTPRRAAPSIPPGVYKRVDLALEFVGDQPARREIFAHGQIGRAHV